MGEFLAWYVFLLKWQFTNFWFYVWLIFGVGMVWMNKQPRKKALFWVAGSTVFMPIVIIVLKWAQQLR